MTDLFKTAVLLLLKPECYDQYFVNFNFFHGECMKATVSKILGLIIVAGSLVDSASETEVEPDLNYDFFNHTFNNIQPEGIKQALMEPRSCILQFLVKVPQILKILKNKSGEGISIAATALELSAMTTYFLYSYLKQFPFSAWGDGLFLTFQTTTVLGLIFYYKKLRMQLIGFLVSFSTLIFLILIEVIPISFLWLMQLLNLPIVILAKGAQILTSYRLQSTGQLSAITLWMQFGGATARVFTSVQETGDMAVILTFVFASILNGVIVYQLYYYGKSTQKKGKGKGKGKSKGKKSD